MKKTIGIIGNGFVGGAVANGLKSFADIRIYDALKERSTHHYNDVIFSDFIFVCLPTPMVDVEGGKCNLSIVEEFFSTLPSICEGIFIIKSTVPIGTTEKLRENYPHLKIIHNPEFLTAAKANEDFGNAQQKWNSLGWMGRSNVLKKVGLDNISPDTNVWELNSDDWDTISAELIDYDTESKAGEKGEWDWLDKGADSKSVDYDKVKYEDDGVSDISVPNTEEPRVDGESFLDNVSFGVESVDYVYPTKANETKDKSYITESEPFEEEYEEFEDSDKEKIEETITLRKLTGYSDSSIARELHINYDVSHEEALEKVYSIEVSTNDRVAQTFFSKMYKECTESEKDELRMYSGSD